MATVDCGEPEGAARKALAQRHRYWLKRKTSQGTQWRPRKRQRVGAAKWGAALDRGLDVSSGAGLERFQVQATADGGEPPAKSWKRLTIACDQGSDGVCCINALQRKFRLNVDAMWDPSHGLWNDILLSLSMMGSSSWVYLMLVVFNLPCGPWSDDARFKMVVESQKEITKIGLHNLPLYQHYTPQLRQELADDPAGADDSDASILEACLEHSPWVKKGVKVSRNRFLGFIYKGLEVRRHWHKMKVSYLHTALAIETYPISAQNLPSLGGVWIHTKKKKAASIILSVPTQARPSWHQIHTKPAPARPILAPHPNQIRTGSHDLALNLNQIHLGAPDLAPYPNQILPPTPCVRERMQ